ncbi:geranylgeranylglycerol-phosphate geranylgeranyltransferase [Flavobacteriaceae bacterium]|nr:geranylgeranylglycerol-phosphate geranylgeranyltransferase [Flavobacteriaceae bacterium]MDC1180242.1 geranylgeranylglycerol-phosphate geranylgeranyltransferase [Flavobacteriaceae bacterium]
MKDIFYKFISLFSVIRLYNIFIIIIAQYFTSIFIISIDTSISSILFDFQLFLLILSSSIAIASGYIINNFYDYEKDLINKPIKSKIDKVIRKRTKLSLYITLNFLCIYTSSLVSWRSVLFFTIYIFIIWLYSHKLKRILFIGNIVSSLLSVIPFFIILIYYKNFELIIFLYAIFLFLIVYMREIIKDLENIKGDFTLDYRTIPVVYGEKSSKYLLSIVSLFTVAIIYILLSGFDTGMMFYYYYFSIAVLLFFIIVLWKYDSKKYYNFLHNLLKSLIVLGVLSIVLIDFDLFLEKFYILFNYLILP